MSSIAWSIGKAARSTPVFVVAETSLIITDKLLQDLSPGPGSYQAVFLARRRSPAYSITRAKRQINIYPTFDPPTVISFLSFSTKTESNSSQRNVHCGTSATGVLIMVQQKQLPPWRMILQPFLVKLQDQNLGHRVETCRSAGLGLVRVQARIT